nr:hypothetical protein CFP56_32587 [Quercus suber]
MSVLMGSGRREAVVSQPQPPHCDGGAEDEDTTKSLNKLMCCVELNSKLYFIGGEFHNGVLDLPYVDEDVKIKYKFVTRDRYPSDVYCFEPTTTTITTVEKMHTGKSLPLAFVVDEKIYVLGSTYIFAPFFEYRDAIRKDTEKLSLFECYDPQLD